MLILIHCLHFTVVDLYTCEIHFNTVRLIAVFIICLGFLMLLLPEDWDQCIIQLSTKLRKRDEPAEGSVEAGATTGLNWRGRARTSTFTHWLQRSVTMQTQTRGGRHVSASVGVDVGTFQPAWCPAPSLSHSSLAKKILGLSSDRKCKRN